jgi:multidrug efflux pump subunit AcrB
MDERPERIFVEFSNAQLANLGVAPQDVFTALSKENAITPAGSIDTSVLKYLCGLMVRSTIYRRSATPPSCPVGVP